jgi:uncharacterized membrane protein (DUF4010 family)
MSPVLHITLDLFVAALVGLAVGSEREWSGHATGPDARFAGLRTFAVIGGLGGIAGWWFRDGLLPIAVVLLVALLLFPIVAYATTMRRSGSTSDGTTEVAAIAVVVMGVVAGMGYRAIASGAAALVVLLLAEKTKLHQMLRRIDELEMRAALHFAVLALVVLPLLPDGSFGPYGAFRPRQLWIVVLLFSGLNFAGYIARRIIGETHGLGVTGLLGGLVSSTAVSLNFSRRSREEPNLSLPLALGVVAACTVLLPRVYAVASVLQPALALPLLPYLIPPFLVGISIAAVALWFDRGTRDGARQDAAVHGADTDSAGGPAPEESRHVAGLRNPLGLWSSVQMAIAFQVVLFLVAWLQDSVGSAGVLVTAAVLGLTDVDALTVSMTRLAAEPANVAVAALAIGIGVLSNTALKTGLVVTIGASRFRARAATGLLLLGAGSVIGLLLGSR